MSHRIATQTKITEKKLAEKALKAQKWDFQSQGDSINVTSGPMRRSTINLKTGEVVGDTDIHNRNDLGALNQSYGEALVEDKVRNQGGEILERTVMKDGRVRILANVNYT